MTARKSSSLGILVVDISQRLHQVESHPPGETALAVEASARSDADKTLSKAIGDEAKSRADADKALGDRLPTKLTGTLTLSAGIGIAAGKTVRTIPVPGLKAGDDLTVTPKAALPPGLAMAEAWCATDGTLSVAFVATALVTIAAKTEIPLGVAVLR